MKDLFAELQERNKRVTIRGTAFYPEHIEKYSAYTDGMGDVYGKTWKELEDNFAALDPQEVIKSQLLAAENRANELRAKLGGEK